ncbi:MAG: sigma-70 family RNA polymerase sigma factor [Bacteroidales bacterium]|nr:sigma-70 family RNA polymerase sigma factor [Bacteroidales bacterium]MCF8344806.1 sigma-70 family RNA polymerase sigma factor [Bacteroidales bacterium]MCF8352569.1 sigma-70 family RNA polymerase sigma factor [Bacteroidales bacterium]MCF8377625.1 sigma-70 family RNA polymerase sigma factor [Bacteroidales bacterium]MCF8402031.1 sigma-70 family RNA polymerase sigma factor [Bacteroidales bacterium]
MDPLAPTDHQILEGIKSGNRKILNYVYSSFFPQVDRFVNANSGNTFEAKDVFQEALYSLFLKTIDNRIRINRSFGAYFFSSCVNIWYAALNKRNYAFEDIDKFQEEIAAEKQDLKKEMNEIEKIEIYISSLNKLDKVCRKIIEMSMSKFTNREIMKMLNLSTEGFTRQKKLKCFRKLQRIFKQEPGFKKVIDELG